MRLLPMPDEFAQSVHYEVHSHEELAENVWRAVATHPTRPDIRIVRPVPVPKNRHDPTLHPQTQMEMKMALWVSGHDAYDTEFSEAPMSITELSARKTRNAAMWTPRDVMVDLLRRMDGGEYPNCDALVICWRERVPKEAKMVGVSSFYSASAPDIHVTTGLLMRGVSMLNGDREQFPID